jgi:signal transduction histidine kinase
VDRLFFRFCLKLAISLAAAAVLAAVLVLPTMRERVGRNFGDALTTSVAITAAVLAESAAQGADVEAALDRAARRLRGQAKIVRRGEVDLDAADEERLDGGEAVVARRFPGPVVYARIEGTDRVLRVGPMRPVHPLGEGRGLAIAVLFIGGLSVGVYLLVRPIERRLARLTAAAAALGKGDLGARAEPGANDVIGGLARAFNAMAGEIGRLLAAQEELLRMVSHELRTPLQRIHFAIAGIAEARGSEDRERAIARIERDLDELDELIEELLTYVRVGDKAPQSVARVDLGALVAEICETLAGSSGEVALVGEAPAGGPVAILAEPRLVRRAVSNLVLNAQRHARSRVEVTVEADHDTVRIHVDDDGAGVPARERERIFEPFHRLDDERTRSARGVGLGLAIVRRIAELYGGSVTVLTSALGGARFRLSFPKGS